MDFDLSDGDLAFRDEFRSWLAEHSPPDVDVAATFEEAETLREWQRTLHEGRWVGIHWPEEYGGRGASLLQVAIYNEELARAQAPQILGRAGVNLVGPTLIAHGTDEQRRRWLRKITGESEFNEVFFDGVPVPRQNLIGEANAGWRVAGTTLANERGTSFVWKEQVLHEVARDLLWKRSIERGHVDDPLVRQKLAQSWMEVEIFRLHNARTLTRLARGEQIGPESSIVTLFWTEMSQKLAEHAGSIFGQDALVQTGDPRTLDRGRWARAMLWSRSAST